MTMPSKQWLAWRARRRANFKFRARRCLLRGSRSGRGVRSHVVVMVMVMVMVVVVMVLDRPRRLVVDRSRSGGRAGRCFLRDCIASEAERKNCGGGKALNHERMILSWLLKPKWVHAGQ
jgi:hypothetical protein